MLADAKRQHSVSPATDRPVHSGRLCCRFFRRMDRDRCRFRNRRPRHRRSNVRGRPFGNRNEIDDHRRTVREGADGDGPLQGDARERTFDRERHAGDVVAKAFGDGPERRRGGPVEMHDEDTVLNGGGEAHRGRRFEDNAAEPVMGSGAHREL
jgi:hypothetical protein